MCGGESFDSRGYVICGIGGTGMTDQKKKQTSNKASDQKKVRKALPKSKELKNTQSNKDTAGGIGPASYYCSNQTVCDH